VRVLVTGSQGYLGSVLAPDLARRGHDVVGLDTGWYVDAVLGAPPPEPRSWRRDIRDLGAEDLIGFDAVVHLAGLSNDPLGELAPDTTLEINHEATIALAQRAAMAGVERFVFVSSCSVYGATAGGLVDETAPLYPVTTYAVSKIAAETDLIRLVDEDFTPVVLRFATLFGWSPRMRFDLVVNDLTASAFAIGRILVRSDGMAFRPVLHVRDAVAAVAAVLDVEREQIRGAVINVGSSGENHRVCDLADQVSAVFGHCPIDVQGESSDERTYQVSFDRMTRLLPRFTCAWDLKRGVHDLRRHFEATALDEDGYRSSAFRRVAQLRELIAAGNLDECLHWKTPRNVTSRGRVA
jgi:nucleoside-diphosphate-sugar epimerase